MVVFTIICNFLYISVILELGSVISSDLPARNAFSIADAGGFDLDDYIRSYLLEHSDMSFAIAVKIILRYYITPELIIQLSEFEDYLKTVNHCLFVEVFNKSSKFKE